MRPLAAYRAEFGVASRLTYLNHAAVGPLPARTVAAVQAAVALQAEQGAGAAALWRHAAERARAAMARLLHCSPGELAVAKNTPEALSFVANGFPWREGDEVVLCDLEFPSNVYPWLNLERRGVRVHVVPTSAGRAPAELLMAACGPRTRVLAVSSVQFSSGYRMDLAALGAFCRERDIWLVVDGIQSIGVLRLDVKAAGLDCLGFASHKWLLSPPGVGWFYCRAERLPQLHVAEVGQGSVAREDHQPFLGFPFVLRPDAERFQPGVLNYLGLVGVEASLSLLEEVGMDRIEARVLALTDALCGALAERGFIVQSDRSPGARSGIVAFSSPREPNPVVLERVTRAGVAISLREGWLRASPHFYNDESDLEALLQALRG